MKHFRLVDNLLGWLAFAIAAFVYCSTVEPTASFWDCPEFITTAYKLEVGHPPGAPFFMLTGNLFTQLTNDPTKVALMVNIMSALMSALCIMFLYWSISHLARKLICKDGWVQTAGQLITIEAAAMTGDQHLQKLGVRIFDWQYEWGWDKEYGGIINFRDCKGLPCQDYSQDMKFWWPQCETVIASLYAYKLTRDDKYLDIWQKANDWMLEHFRDPDYGEWFGYLHRDGTVAQPAKGNLFKGPFHIPRMMLKAAALYDEILGGGDEV